MKKGLCWILPAALALSGCAANLVKRGSNDIHVPPEGVKRIVLGMSGNLIVIGSAGWAPFQGVLCKAFANEAKAAGIAFTMLKSSGAGEAGTLLEIQLNDYRYLGTGMRYGPDGVAGSGYVNANVRRSRPQDRAQLRRA